MERVRVITSSRVGAQAPSAPAVASCASGTRAISALVEGGRWLGERLEVEVRPDIAILWQRDVPLAARLGASMLVRRGGDEQSRAAIEKAACAEGLVLHTMGEQRLWKLLGVPG